jgi:hypothetical protein
MQSVEIIARRHAGHHTINSEFGEPFDRIDVQRP